MPKTGSLPADASAELGQAAYERMSHEMRNDKGADDDPGNQDLDQLAYGHRPIKRGSQHRR